jgi:hypothetical protein
VSRPFGHLRVAAVLDEFSRACLAPEVKLLDLHARRWRLQLATARRPDLLLVESVWLGRAESWKRSLEEIPAIVSHCRKRGVPTAFWNKEDPVFFDRFLDTAKHFDVVFTTDEACLPAYERRLGRGSDTVRCLPFFAQPTLHRPPRPGEPARTSTVCFAGSYGEPELPERRRELEVLLEAAVPFGLTILDRARGPHKRFPDRFAPYLRPPVRYADLADHYRRHRVFLNVNSVASSPTMFARRVFELLACGTAVVSSPSVGMERLFGDVVAVARDEREARDAIERFLGDDAHYAEVTARGIERVREAHTAAHRLADVCAAAGIAT